MLSCVLRKVTLIEDDGTQTEWVLVGWQGAKDQQGFYYVRLFLMSGQDVREDVTMPVFDFNSYMNNPELWPRVELTATNEDADGPLWVGRGATPRGQDVPITQSCPCAKPRCKGQCMHYTEPEPEEWWFSYAPDGRYTKPERLLDTRPIFPEGFEVSGPYASASEAQAAIDGWLEELREERG